LVNTKVAFRWLHSCWPFHGYSLSR